MKSKLDQAKIEPYKKLPYKVFRKFKNRRKIKSILANKGGK